MGQITLYQGPNKLTGAMLYCRSFWGSRIRVQGFRIALEIFEVRVEGWGSSLDRLGFKIEA